MTKWADYGISGVRYDSTHTRIMQVKVHLDGGDTIGAASIISRTDVVNAINRGTSYVTIVKNGNGQWTKGEDVRKVTINGADYIRTDNNRTARDNLENLPEF
jgi:hypothetical protein